MFQTEIPHSCASAGPASGRSLRLPVRWKTCDSWGLPVRHCHRGKFHPLGAPSAQREEIEDPKSMASGVPSELQTTGFAGEAGAQESAALGAWHGLLWMVVANVVGLLLASLLLFPRLDQWLGEWTYGRWVPVHLNLHLYGWTSIPLLAWLMRLYRVEAGPAQGWVRSVYWLWSLALLVGSVSWLEGQSSGKIFLDWTGYARVLLPVAMLWMWCVLAWSWVGHWRRPRHPGMGRPGLALKGLGLLGLLMVPAVWFWSAGQGVYPAVNPESGGPTGVSLLGSMLLVIFLLLLLPATISPSRRGASSGPRPRLPVLLGWGLFCAELILFFWLDKSNSSHHRLAQILGLGSVLIWLFVMPLFYGCHPWPSAALPWKRAFLVWLGLLVLTGWASFLPGILDRLKFTDGLVAHSHLAMAGFVTAFNMFILSVLWAERRAQSVWENRWAFWSWQAGTFGYLLLMWVAGWIEGGQPSFTIQPSVGRNLIYGLRWTCGLVMLGASVFWFLRAHATLRCPTGSGTDRGRTGQELGWPIHKGRTAGTP